MVRARGNLQRQSLEQPGQAQIIKTEVINHNITVAPAPKEKKKKEKRPLSLYVVALSLAAVLLAGGVAWGFAQGKLSLGNVAVDELTAYHVVLNVNSKPEPLLTNAATVEELLNEEGILLDETDYLGQRLNQPLREGMTIWLRLSIPISVVADGQVVGLQSQPITVQQALEMAGVELGPQDTTNLPLLQYIYEATEIQVRRVRTETVTEQVPIEPEEEQRMVPYLAPGNTTVISAGTPGVMEITYEVTYENNEELSRKKLEEKVVTEPKNRVVAVGSADSTMGETGEVQLGTTDSGAEFYYTKQVAVEATAYTATGNLTATGAVAQRGVIAVDPNVIPLGTKVYVSGYGFATAADTGGAVKGNIIDLYMDTERECINWGRRQTTLYILVNE